MSMNHSVEFIGKKIKVVHASNKSLEGIEGTILDETKSTFTIRDKNTEDKKLLKQGTVFLINNQIINGDEISKRPEERIKLKK